MLQYSFFFIFYEFFWQVAGQVLIGSGFKINKAVLKAEQPYYSGFPSGLFNRG
jgi:hypothetical protein